MKKTPPCCATGMKKSDASLAVKVSVALVHYPVVDRKGETIAAAVTSLDLHDIARCARTFGVESFYVVTPLADQQLLVTRILDHWVSGAGAGYNPDRRNALALIRLQPSLADAVRELEQRWGALPKTVATSASMTKSDLSHTKLRELTRKGEPLLLVFGTSWGLAPQIVDQADYRLAPVQGNGDYNHLAVRSAVAIILDRIMGETVND